MLNDLLHLTDEEIRRTKIRCCTEAIEAGVKKVFVIDGRIPHAILIEMLTDEGIGTMFTKAV